MLHWLRTLHTLPQRMACSPNVSITQTGGTLKAPPQQVIWEQVPYFW
ncbi:6-deoxyerythronolide-B synthase [Acetobacter orientalis]|uniref:6-deoxyerythronolide-B synthase n=1 Tax=Acetobacter orientalis TaxID=146474 RepID=A0A2Z5ZK96_9PROT|nr:6-deoxyerythronolide-B synthase [Acetobacter orientalis]